MECDSNEHCPQKSQRTLPSRVIEVYSERDPKTPRLLATNGLLGYYTALSYCWGTNQKGVTMKSNLESRLQQLDMASLSRTIQDAILITRTIGVKYLWVDAICIIQDSEEDKTAELSAMCNITASSGNYCGGKRQRCWPRVPRRPRSAKPFYKGSFLVSGWETR